MQGELQYFIGVQLDGSEYLEPERRGLPKKTEKEGTKEVQETAGNIDGALRELPDANMVLLLVHSRIRSLDLHYLLAFNKQITHEFVGLRAQESR